MSRNKTANPAAPGSQVTTFERKPGEDSRDIKLDSPSERVDHAQGASEGIALVDTKLGIEQEPTSALAKQALALEAFMQEKVEIMLASPGSEEDHKFCEPTVNGIRLCLIRDDETVHSIPRAHLAVIAGAKIQRLVQKKITNPDGSMGYEEKAQLQALYPFSVFHDANPRGGVWLRQLMQRG